MEETDVVIVGAGPSGLALALALAHRRIKSVLLEANEEITQDPRAIAISGDTPRILRLLGLSQDSLKTIGHALDKLSFHHRLFTDASFLDIPQDKDWFEQATPMGVCLLQPKLEQKLRDLIKLGGFGDLRTGCRVSSRKEFDDAVEVSYETRDGTARTIRGKFLIGADGKRGTVRKAFLAPKGIRQETGINEYGAKWIAANLLIQPPTPESHPSFPLWECGYNSEDVWDLFWPKSFHFCNHPTTPVAAGRFGPQNEKYFRFEYELPEGGTPEDLISDLRDKVTPHITLPTSRLQLGQKLGVSEVVFPWDCVKIIRCQPAFFVHKVVNQWFDNRTILIGDAAHVFPPFGAQGIANGIRDAIGLSWRLSFLCGKDSYDAELLNQWSRERRYGVDEASKNTMMNGELLRNRSWVKAEAIRICSGLLGYFPSIKDSLYAKQLSDNEGFAPVKDGFFLPGKGGGGKIAQVWLRSSNGSNFLSDTIFWRPDSILTVLVLGVQASHTTETGANLQEILQASKLPEGILSTAAVSIQTSDREQLDATSDRYHICTIEELQKSGVPIIPRYNPLAFLQRFHPTTRYAFIRPDMIVFAQAPSLEKLKEILLDLEQFAGLQGQL